MKRMITIMISAGIVSGAAFAEVAVTVDTATAYVFRGATVVDELVVQPGIEVSDFGMPEEYGSISLGVWGSMAPFMDTYDNLHETDWYVAYSLPMIVSNLDLYVAFTEYQYVAPAGEKEVNFGASYILMKDVTVGGTANFMTDDENGLTEKQKYFEAFVDVALNLNENLTANVGGAAGLMFQGDGNSSLGLNDGLNQYELRGSLAYAINEMWGIGGSLTYVGQLDDNVLPDSVYDKGLVAMLSLGCDM